MRIEEFDRTAAYEQAEAPSRRVEPTSKAECAWDGVVRVLAKHYFEPDAAAARLLYAAVAAHDLKGQPVWPMIVAPPGAMKTELIRALDGVPRVHSVDAFTSKTFISGQIREGKARNASRQSSLLHRIGPDGIVLCPDFSTVLAIKVEERNSIFADMRRIFDGELKKEFGTSEEVPVWKGRLTFVVGMTPEIDRHHGVINRLGDRFLMIRMAPAGLEAAKVAMRQDLNAAREELADSVRELLGNLPSADVVVADRFVDQLAALGEFVVRARTDVVREGQDKTIAVEPQAESATRLSQQLCQLAKGNARLDRRTELMEQDVEDVKRAAIDCIPPRRWRMLERALRGESISIVTSTDQYDRDDLDALGLMTRGRISELALDLVGQFGDLTKSPPNASEQIHTSLVGTFREGDRGHGGTR